MCLCVCLCGRMYGTNHTKLNVLRAYPFSENGCEMDKDIFVYRIIQSTPQSGISKLS